MKFNTRFGKTIDISLDHYLSMSDEELEKLEEAEGANFSYDSTTYFDNFENSDSVIEITED